MTYNIIIIFCLLILLAYVLELLAKRIQAPSVIFLLLLGWGFSQLMRLFSLSTPSLDPVLPIIGTVGLILIVLEGAMELELSNEKYGLAKQSCKSAIIPIVFLGLIISLIFYNLGEYSFRNCLTNAIPFCIISSAIAIPSVISLPLLKREFVTFESSISDIIGVILFNFVSLNHEYGVESIEHFILQIVAILVITFFGIIGISFLLTHIKSSVKYVPVLLIVILIYSISKTFHLPGLVFVLLCGLFLGNIERIKLHSWIIKLHPVEIADNLFHLKKITVEFTFVLRVIFFLLFGFLLKTEDILNLSSLGLAIVITLSIYAVRALTLVYLKMPLIPLLYVAPRGLITVLLFLLVPPESSIPIVNRSLITQIILLSSAILLIGLMTNKNNQSNDRLERHL